MMRRSRSLVALATALVSGSMGCGINPSGQTIITQSQTYASLAVPGQVLIKFQKGTSIDAISAFESRFGLVRLSSASQSLARVGWHLMAVKGPSARAALMANLAAHPDVLHAEPNYAVSLPPMRLAANNTTRQPVIFQDPPAYDDPLAKDQYAILKADTAHAHTVTMGNPATILAIVDTGVDWSHPDLKTIHGKERVLKGRDHVAGNDNPRDGHGHGTHCAGIAAATAFNAEGIVGVAANVTILAEKVLSDGGSGSYASVSSGIIHAVDLGAKVISMSLGGRATAKVLEDAIAYALAKDVLVVAAMGNDGRKVKIYPGALPGVMAIGSTTKDDKRSGFSNFGEWISLTAPGSVILSTLPTFDNAIGQKNYGSLSGTSMATPLAAGIAALVRDLHPQWDYKAVRSKVESASEDLGAQGFDEEYGHGRVNAFRAVTDLP